MNDAGLAEAVKHGAIADSYLIYVERNHQRLNEGDLDHLYAAVSKAVR